MTSLSNSATARRLHASFALALILGTFGCRDAPRYAEATSVSLIQLIADPQTYHDKTVVVVGFLSLDFEGTALFLHEVDFVQGLTKNGIWLALDPERIATYEHLARHYVIVEGRFSQRPKGHFGIYSGTIADITRIEIYPSRAELDSDH